MDAKELVGLADDELLGRREVLTAELAATGPFTPGSFQVEHVRCGKPSCHCAKDGDPGHGPFYSVARRESGRTMKRRVPVGLLDVVRGRVAAWEAFRDVCDELADVNAEESRRLLLGKLGGSVRAPEKGG